MSGRNWAARVLSSAAGWIWKRRFLPGRADGTLPRSGELCLHRIIIMQRQSMVARDDGSNVFADALSKISFVHENKCLWKPMFMETNVYENQCLWKPMFMKTNVYERVNVYKCRCHQISFVYGKQWDPHARAFLIFISPTLQKSKIILIFKHLGQKKRPFLHY